MGAMYRRIMLTSDGSWLASSALPHAVAFATAGDATVVLVAAIDGLEELRAEGRATGWLDLGGELSDADLETGAEEQRALAGEHLGALRSALSDEGVGAVEEHVVSGSAGAAIVSAAEEFSCDLIVMATHGRGGLGRAVLGSVADHVARHAGCPVLLVRSSEPV